MDLKSRLDLKALFLNGSRPSQGEFHALIDSMLNKRDDRFLGHWKSGMAYRTGDVVIYNNALWTVPPDKDGHEQDICSANPPGENSDWESLIVPVQDDDWDADEETGIMFAKVFQCVGIGRRFEESGEIPVAKLDIDEENKGRFLILPKPADAPTLSLFQFGEGNERTYYLTGLDENHVGLTTDAPDGFIFRRSMIAEEEEAAELDYRDGDILMVIQPDAQGLARVGISTPEPAAMLDITDQAKGQFLFNPDDKDDPALTIVNLDPETAKNYLATGVGEEWSTFVTDTPKGYIFRHGADYGTFCAHENINQGASLVVIRYDEADQPRVGIGTEEPCSMLEVTDQTNGQFVMNPEANKHPVFLITKMDQMNDNNYLASGVSTDKSILQTDASSGFAFKSGDSLETPCTQTDLDLGNTLVVFLPNGNVGIGLEAPSVRMEVSDNRESGTFLFNLNDKKVNPALGIVNTLPSGPPNYLTLGPSDQTSIMITNSPNGFSFRIGGAAGVNDNEVDIDQNSETLLHLRPERASGNTTLPREMRVFPEATGNLSPEVEINGKVGVARGPRNYELDIDGTARSFGFYINTDSQKMVDIQDLTNVLDKLIALKPRTFQWSNATGHEGEGPQIGLLAHEVEQKFPEVVKVTPQDPLEDQTKSVAYQNLVPVLVQAIKEQQQLISELQDRVQRLEDQTST